MISFLHTRPRLGSMLFTATVLGSLLLGSTSAWAGDPFRGNNNPSNISDRTEDAFEAMFKAGDYPEANRIISRVQDDADPLVPALQAALAYNLSDDNTIPNMDRYVERTRNAAQALIDQPNASQQDQLRGNLYLAAAAFMEGAYEVRQSGDYVAAALKVQDIFRYLRQADKIDQEAGLRDPELNLVKGYIELLLSVNLPLSNPENAIENFEVNAAPDYLVHRGIAIAYRDLGYKIGANNPNPSQVRDAIAHYKDAMKHVDAILKVSPKNPEIHYLQAQIFHEWSKLPEQENREMLERAIDLFKSALAKVDQLPTELKGQIEHELGVAQTKLAEWNNS